MTKERLSRPSPALQRRAEAYARHPLIRRPRWRRRFAAFAAPGLGERVLDVACGPGFNALAFARRAGEVIAIDPSPEMLEQARREAHRRRLANISFRQAPAEHLPFPDDSFHVVTCAAALHHIASPRWALLEMSRVCLPGGRVAIEEIIAHQQEVRARYHNRLERLRDRSHRRFLPLAEIIALLGEVGLAVRQVEVLESLREFNEWVAAAGTPPGRAEHLRRLLQGSIERDLSGLRVQAVDDTFLFIQQVAWILALKPD